jgi:aquaglyceroporin related protein
MRKTRSKEGEHRLRNEQGDSHDHSAMEISGSKPQRETFGVQDGLEQPEPESPDRNTFGVQDGLHNLEKKKTSTTQGTVQRQEEEKEYHEDKDRVEQEKREFYNKYRNPLARLRARHPEPLAEFLAVSTTHFST